MPRVSVIIPTYNHAQFLGAALDSLRAQTMPNWEAIVVNNFSTDATVELVAAYSDTRIRLINFANQGVIAASRNRGIGLASGEYVAFLDSDDFWEPAKLERCLEKLTRPLNQGVDLVCHGERWLREDGGVRDVIYGPENRASIDSLLFHGNCISTSAVVVRREWLDRVNGFDESIDLITAEDYHLWLKLARAGARVGFLNEILGTYRMHAGNQSRAVLRNVGATRAVFERMSADLPRPFPVRVKIRRRHAILDYSAARGLMEHHEHRAASVWFIRAIVRWPFSLKFYVAAWLNLLGRTWR